MMISTTEAFNILLSCGITDRVTSLPLTSCAGKVLAQDIICDHDLPPFDRVMMDGFALRFSGLSEYSYFEVMGEQRAGFPPCAIHSSQHCIEVMTGCVLPSGCDTVVPIEQTFRNGSQVRFNPADIKFRQHIHHQAKDHVSGNVLVAAGTRVHAGIIAIAASCGLSELKVYSISSAAIVSTGDELVDIDLMPKPWQIRKSNSYLLSTVLNGLGINHSIHHSLDDEIDLSKKIESVADAELVLMSGGVSMGKFDLVPAVLISLGYEILFHKVLQKPGKPILAAKRNEQLVIAFPGNPVSVMACVCRYLLPLLDERYRDQFVKVAHIKHSQSSLNLLLPVTVKSGVDGRRMADSLSWSGSGDIASLSRASGFVEIERDVMSLPEKLSYFPIP
jgi:molybdopterin molybdotransferase